MELFGIHDKVFYFIPISCVYNIGGDDDVRNLQFGLRIFFGLFRAKLLLQSDCNSIFISDALYERN